MVKYASVDVLQYIVCGVCSGQYGSLHIMLCLCNHFYLFLAKIRHTFFYWSKRVDQGTAWTYFCDILKPIYPGFSTFSSWIILVSAVTSILIHTHVDVPKLPHTAHITYAQFQPVQDCVHVSNVYGLGQLVFQLSRSSCYTLLIHYQSHAVWTNFIISVQLVNVLLHPQLCVCFPARLFIHNSPCFSI